jgi:hypothetical protein
MNGWQVLNFDGYDISTSLQGWELPLLLVAGVLLLFVTLHIARGIGHRGHWQAPAAQSAQFDPARATKNPADAPPGYSLSG